MGFRVATTGTRVSAITTRFYDETGGLEWTIDAGEGQFGVGANAGKVATGGLGIGGAIAGVVYTDWGYAGSTYIAAISMSLMAFLVWVFVPEPDLKPKTVPFGRAAPPVKEPRGK